MLLGLTWPRMDGIETFRSLKAIRPGVPVVLCSGFAQQDTMERFPGLALAGFIQKPFTLQMLRETLDRIL